MTTLKKQIEEVLRKHEDIWVGAEGYLVRGDTHITTNQATDQIIKIFESVLPEEKEIQTEELDTGIGIDVLTYDGQERQLGFNSALSDLRKIIKGEK